VLEGRHGGLVGTKALGEEKGPCLCMGMIMSLCLIFYVFFCKPVDVVEGIPSGPAILMEVSAMSE